MGSTGCRIISVDAKAHALLAVAIVFDRTTTIILALLHGVRQLHQHTETEHIAHLGSIGSGEVFGYIQLAGVSSKR